MNFYDGRYIHLMRVLRGYEKTGVLLVAFDDSGKLATSIADDLGMYVIIPKMAHLFSISIERAIEIVFYGSLGISTLIAFICLCQLFKNKISPFINLFFLTQLVILALRLGPFYAWYIIAPLFCIPLCLTITKSNLIIHHVYYFIIGLVVGFSHFMRAYAALPTFVFVLGFLAISFLNAYKKIALSCFLCIGILFPYIYFSQTYQSYITFLKNQKQEQLPLKEHVFWHTVYCGLGFLQYLNTENIYWDDSCAMQKVPSEKMYVTKAYEDFLRAEIIRLIKEQPIFIVYTIFAKLGALLLYFLIFCNIGLIAAWRFAKGWKEDLLWLIVLFCSALFPLIALPITSYCAGFIAITILYATISLNYAAQKMKIGKGNFSLKSVIINS